MDEPSAYISFVTVTVLFEAAADSSASSEVMIFVVLAIGSLSPAFFSNKNSPLFTQNSAAALAETPGAFSSAKAGRHETAVKKKAARHSAAVALLCLRKGNLSPKELIGRKSA